MRRTVLIVDLLVAAAILTAAAACNATPGTPAATGSGIEGRTMVDAGCPLVRDGTRCPDKPLAAKLTVSRRDSDQPIAETVSDGDGRFGIELPPGHYVLHPANLTGAPVPAAAPVDVDVTDGRYTLMTVSFDSGVR